MAANDRQVDGEHYKNPIQHWDWVASNNFDYFQGQITKYVARWKNKNGIKDLEKAQHVLEKYIELANKEEQKQKHNWKNPVKVEQQNPFGFYTDLEIGGDI